MTRVVSARVTASKVRSNDLKSVLAYLQKRVKHLQNWKTMTLPFEATKLILEYANYEEMYRWEAAKDEIRKSLKRLAKRGNKRHAVNAYNFIGWETIDTFHVYNRYISQEAFGFQMNASGNSLKKKQTLTLVANGDGTVCIRT